jgi:hypothetical protein
MSIYLIAFFGVFSSSAIFYWLGLDHTVVLVFLLAITPFFVLRNLSSSFEIGIYRLSVFVTCFFVFACALVLMIYWSSIRYIHIHLHLLCAMVIIISFCKEDLKKILYISTEVLIVICLGALLGHLVIALGITPPFSFPNANGLPNYFLFTTLSNDYDGKSLRPSGIYDEPGTLSFMVCSVVAARKLSNMNERRTQTLLIMALSTLSLAHVIFMLTYYFSNKYNKKTTILFLVSIVFVALLGVAFYDYLYEPILKRFDYGMEDRVFLNGDNRTILFINAFKIVTSEYFSIFFGVGGDVISGSNGTIDLTNTTENPLTPLLYYGIVGSWPYYFVVSLFLLFPLLKGKRYVFVFGLGLLLLQRPYLYNPGVSLYFAISLFATLSILNNKVDSRTKCIY